MGHLYPPLKAYHSEMLDVGNGHSLYIEQSGNPDGIPVLYLHGGPGAGLAPIYRSLFDPNVYRIIGFDQRGCGQSLPFAEISNNTTQDSLDDIQRIRNHLNISKWMLCGGSWGTTLALLSAIQHPKTVKALVLRGVFLAREEDFDWFFDEHGGAAQLFPEHYEEFVETVKDRSSPTSIVEAFYDVLLNGDELTRIHAAKSWCMWEERISILNNSIKEQDFCQNLHRATSLAFLECHFIKNSCFIEEDYILRNIETINAIPGTIVHGRYDIVCKLQGAHKLCKAWRESQLLIVPEAGHSVSDPRISDALCHATDAMANFLNSQTK